MKNRYMPKRGIASWLVWDKQEDKQVEVCNTRDTARELSRAMNITIASQAPLLHEDVQRAAN